MEEPPVDRHHTEISARATLDDQSITTEHEQELSPMVIDNAQTGSTSSAIERSNTKDTLFDESGSCYEKTHNNLEDISHSTLERIINDVDKLSIQEDSGLSSPVASSKGPEEYQLKWITWHNRNTPIVTQNQNGPCPLIAIANILLLRGKMKLAANASSITAEELITHVANNIVESRPEDCSDDVMRNFEQNMHDAMSLLPQLHTGLDVNVKFTGVTHFEFTEACTVFDLLNISLYHGWVVDPQAIETVHAVGNMGYNQLVEMIIQDKTSNDSFKVTNALLAEQFLETSASQLTYHGLCELNSVMSDNELAVLFRNNHFSTIYKRRVPSPSHGNTHNKQQNQEVVQNELFLLVTDQGFLHEYNVIWEMLCNIEGDSMFVDSNFKTVPPKTSCDFVPPVNDDRTLLQIDQDYMVALALQEDMQRLDESWEDLKKVPDEDVSDTYDENGRVTQKRGAVDAERACKQQQHQQSLKSAQGVQGCSCGASASESTHLVHQPSCSSLNVDARRHNPSASPTSHKKNTCSVL